MKTGRCLNCGRRLIPGPDGDDGDCVCHDPDNQIPDHEDRPMPDEHEDTEQ